MNAAQLKNNPAGLRARDVDGVQMFAEPGGIPIVVDGQMIGAVGVPRRRRRAATKIAPSRD